MIKKILFSIAFTISTNVFSQDIVTDRPDQTESSSTLGKRDFQIESGILYQNSNDNSTQSFFGPSTLFRYGISNGFELRMFLQYEATKIELEGGNDKFSGFNDIEIGAKFQLLKKENVNTEMAFLSHVIVPTANNEVSTNSVGIINKLAISHVVNNTIGVGYNIGFDYVEKRSAFTYAVAIGFSLSEALSFYIEPYGSWEGSDTFDSNFDAGFTYLLSKNFQLDVSYGLGLNNDMYYVSTGFSWRIPDFLGSTN
jgi:hypothetical protein